MLDPTKTSAKFAVPSSKWLLVDALYGGTTTMRAAREAYLPKNPKEHEADYNARVNRSTLYNAYRKTITQAVSRTFGADIELAGYPGEVLLFAEDVDAQDRSLTEFAKESFTDALHRGVSYFLVDLPFREEPVVTLADADRPYWVPIKATQVLAAYSAMDGGSERLTHFRFREYALDLSPDGLTETTVEQVRVFTQPSSTDPVSFTVYRRVNAAATTLAPMTGGNQAGTGWVVAAEGVIPGMPQIPVVPIYTNRVGFYIGTPPLMDLAELNVAHWQSSSEQSNVLHVARVPFLHIKGYDAGIDPVTGKQREQEISIHSVLTTGPEGDAKWVETNGKALSAGFQHMADLETKMDEYGVTLTASRSGPTTATEVAVNTASSSSVLKDYALALAKALEQGLALTAIYLGHGPVSGSVAIDTTFAVDLQAQTEPPEQVAPSQAA